LNVDADVIRATGVPAHVVVMKKLAYFGEWQHHRETYENIVPSVLAGVEEVVVRVLEDRATSAAAVTPHQLRDVLGQMLDDRLAGFRPDQPQQAAQPAIRAVEQQFNLFEWGGEFCRYPADYKLPKGMFKSIFCALLFAK
jgi:hypothetical protein